MILDLSPFHADEFKSSQLESFIGSSFPSASVVTKVSYQSGLCEAVENTPDIILLDMNLPNYDPDSSEVETLLFAGREILQELNRLNICTMVVVVTQFEQFGEGADITTLEELSESLRKEFPGLYVGTVYYHPAQEDWKSALLAAVKVTSN
jgi:CheY-like chemotaxis protein